MDIEFKKSQDDYDKSDMIIVKVNPKEEEYYCLFGKLDKRMDLLRSLLMTPEQTIELRNKLNKVIIDNKLVDRN